MNVKKENGVNFVEWENGKIRLIVHSEFVTDGKYLNFPVRNAEIVKTRKGALVLRPTNAPSHVYLFKIISGWYGCAEIGNITNGEIVAEWIESLGEIKNRAYALINGNENAIVEWSKIGCKDNEIISGFFHLETERPIFFTP